MVVKFYHHAASPACLSVELVLKALGVDVEMIVVDITKGEHLKPEYTKINELKTLPAIDDHGLCLSESTEIIQYLCAKFDNAGTLLSSDKERGQLVGKYLTLNSGMLAKITEWIFPTLESRAEFNKGEGSALRKDLVDLDDTMSGKEYLAGTLSAADLAILGTLVYLEIIQYDFSGLKNIHSWAENLKTKLPYFERVTADFDEYVKHLDKSIFN